MFASESLSCKPSILWRGKLSLSRPDKWCDISHLLQAAIPAVNTGLCHVQAAKGHKLAITNVQHLALAPPAVIAPNRRSEVCVVLMDGRLLYPNGASLTLIREDAEGTPHTDEETVVDLELRLEATEVMLKSLPLSLDPSTALAQAALRGALSSVGVAAEEVEQLEATGMPQSAHRVYEVSYLESKCTRAHTARLPVLPPRSMRRSRAPCPVVEFS